MYFEKLTRKRDTLIQSIRMSESQPEIFKEVSNSRLSLERVLCEIGLCARKIATSRKGCFMDINTNIHYNFHGDLPIDL